jgi:hypothetical protein
MFSSYFIRSIIFKSFLQLLFETKSVTRLLSTSTAVVDDFCITPPNVDREKCMASSDITVQKIPLGPLLSQLNFSGHFLSTLFPIYLQVVETFPS